MHVSNQSEATYQSAVRVQILRAMRKGDEVDYQQMRGVEESRPKWGALARPDVVRACFGIPTDEFLEILRSKR